MSLRRSLACALLLGTALSTSGRAQQTDVAREVSDEFAYLKQIWPEVAEPRIVDSEAAEFKPGDGQILLGRQALQRLADGGGDVVVQFILAHEAWHSVQAARHSQAELDGLRADRLLECEADFMGAAATAGRLAKANVPAEESHQRRSKLEDFIEKAPSTDPGGTYLDPESRAKTISLGWHAALKPELFSFVPDVSKNLDVAARQSCEMLANVSDGSIGRVSVAASRSSVRVKTASSPPSIAVTLNNNSNKKVKISYLLVETWWHVDGPDSPEIVQLFHDEKTMSPKSAGNYTYTVTFRPQQDNGVLSSWSLNVPILSGLVTTKYVEEISRPTDSCYGRLMNSADPADRAMFTSLATIALAAPDDFKAVRSPSFQDSGPGMKTYMLTGGLARRDYDRVEVTTTGSWASLTALESDSEERVKQEYDRIKRVILGACAGTASEKPDAEGQPNLWIREFAPGADLALGTNIWRIGHKGTAPASPGGLVDFMIFKTDASN